MKTTPLRVALDAAYPIDSNAVVYGLHWTPPRRWAEAEPANLDAVCVLRDANGIALEVVGPDRLCSTNGSVIHTGDSRTGASSWDDERVFVFLDPLPNRVSRIDFGVACRNGRRLCEVPGASCHLSDYSTEDELLRVQLTAISEATEYCVATLHRATGRWILQPGAPRAATRGSRLVSTVSTGGEAASSSGMQRPLRRGENS